MFVCLCVFPISPYTLLIDFCAVYFLLVQTDCTEGAEVTETVRPWARTQILCFTCREENNRCVIHIIAEDITDTVFPKIKCHCISNLTICVLPFFLVYLNIAFELEVCQLWGRRCTATKTHYHAHTHICRSAVVVQRLEADVADVRGAHLRCGYRREALTSSQHALGLPGERWFKRSNSKTHTYTTTHINVSEGRCSHNWSRPHQTKMTQLENARIHEQAPYNFLSQMYIFLDALDSLLWFRAFSFKPLKSPQNIL